MLLEKWQEHLWRGEGGNTVNNTRNILQICRFTFYILLKMKIVCVK